MGIRRVAIIGHSGAGKSTCLLALGVDRKLGDMDAVFRTQQSLEKALNWLAADAKPFFVVVSNHEQMLIAMLKAKLEGEYPELFDAIHFVYLRKPKDQLQAHLALPSAGGNIRDESSQRYTLDTYERFDAMFAQLANQSVDCSGRLIDAIATEILRLAQPNNQNSDRYASRGRD